MNHYLFNVTNEERENILDAHKKIYDGYVTEYGGGNMTPLYVVDMAKDKGGVTLNNKGEVTSYKNFGINENINEMRFDNKSTGLFSAEEDDYSNPKAEKSAKSDIKKHFNKSAKRPFHYEEDPSEDWPKHDVDYDTEFDFDLNEQDDMYDYDEIKKSDKLKVGPPLDMIADREDDIKHGTVDFDGDILNFDLGDIIPFDDEDYTGSFDVYFPEDNNGSTEFSIESLNLGDIIPFNAFNDNEDEEDDKDFDYDFDTEDLRDDEFTLEPESGTEFNIDLTHDDEESNDDELSFELGVDDEDSEPIMEQVYKSLDMFKRFKKYN